MNELINPEDTKMSTEDKGEYDGWRGGLTKEEREEHEEDEVYQEEVNWLKFVPYHDFGGQHYTEGFSTKRITKKESLLKIVLLQYGLEAGYLLFFTSC